MERRILVSAEKPQTQCIDAIKALLSWRGRASDPLPSFIEMGEGEGRLVLVLSNKKDAYYTVTAAACSCPAHNWHPGQRCKHQRAYFPEQSTARQSLATIRQPNHGAWHGRNGPVLDEAPSSPLSVIDCHDTTALDVAYHSIKADREMWPVEA